MCIHLYISYYNASPFTNTFSNFFDRSDQIEPLKTRDMTKNTVTTNEIGPGYMCNPLHSYGPHFIMTSTTSSHVAEIETVL